MTSIEEATNCSTENIDAQANDTLEDVHKLILEKHKNLKGMSYKIAYNKILTTPHFFSH